MNEKIDQILKRLIDKLKYENDIIGILLHGSYAKGTSHTYSDIDLYVISQTKGSSTSFFYFEDMPVQIIWRTLEEFKDKVMKPTRNKGIALVGRILYDQTGIISEYVEKAKLSLSSPKPLTEFEKKLIVIDLSTDLLTIKGLIEAKNFAGAALKLNELTIEAIDLLYDYHKWFTVTNKHLVNDLKTHHIEYGELVERIILETVIDQKFILTEMLINRIFTDCNLQVINEYDVTF